MILTKAPYAEDPAKSRGRKVADGTVEEPESAPATVLEAV